MVSMSKFILSKNIKIQVVSLVLTITIFLLSSIVGYSIDLGFEQEEFTATTKEIFLNNTTLCLYLILGMFTFGIMSFILLVINGIYLGSALNYYVENNGFEQMLYKFLPHAIFELPAIILSASIGFYLIVFVIEKGSGRNNMPAKFYLGHIMKTIVLIIVLLFIAAFMESYISMKIYK